MRQITSKYVVAVEGLGVYAQGAKELYYQVGAVKIYVVAMEALQKKKTR
jgi:hypothetical protein